MAIQRDLSELPSAQGLMPDPEPRFAGLLAEWWSTRDDGHVPSGKGFRHSDAGKCARALSYRAAQIPRSDPMDLPGFHNVELGTLIHEAWQEALPAMFTVERAQAMFDPDEHVVVDVQVVCEPGIEIEAIDSIGFIDAVVTITFDGDNDPYVIAVELKSIGGWGFKSAIGKARRGALAEGPKDGHLLQGALNGLAVNADEIVIAYIAKECMSVGQYREASPLQRFTAEWSFTREVYEPLAKQEITRVARVLELVAEGDLAPRKTPDMPPGSEITDPATGDWQQWIKTGDGIDGESPAQLNQTGNSWECNYCSYQSLCATTEAGRIPIGSVVKIGESGMSMTRELDQYVAELRAYENAVRRTQGYSSNAYGMMERSPDGGAAASFGEFVEGVARVFGPPLAQAVRVAADPYEAAIHNLASDLSRSQTTALMWEDFARWRDARAAAFQAIFADARREAEAGNAHLRDVIGGALHGRKSRRQIVDLLAPLVAEDEEPF